MITVYHKHEIMNSLVRIDDSIEEFAKISKKIIEITDNNTKILNEFLKGVNI